MKSETINIDKSLDWLAFLPHGLKKIVMKVATPNLDVLVSMKPEAINGRLGLLDKDDTGFDVQKAALVASTSLIYWWNALSKVAGIDVPKTKIVQISRKELGKATLFNEDLSEAEGDKNWEEFAAKYLPKIKEAWIEVAGSLDKPVFMRTDYFSSKHDWKDTCFIPKYEDDLFHTHLYRLIEDSECADFFGLQINALVFREFLDLDIGFKFFHGDMPVAAERRYFIENGKVSCHHAYWFAEVFEADCQVFNNMLKTCDPSIIKKKDLKTKTYPKALLARLNKESVEEVKLLTGHAEAVGKVLEGFWSVDFARAKDGTWFLIDMARGESSYHPPCAMVKR